VGVDSRLVSAGTARAEWVECGWDVPAAAVAYRTLVAIQLCCATDDVDRPAGSSSDNHMDNVEFWGDIGERSS
jgi:hypothetical protein